MCNRYQPNLRTDLVSSQNVYLWNSSHMRSYSNILMKMWVGLWKQTSFFRTLQYWWSQAPKNLFFRHPLHSYWETKLVQQRSRKLPSEKRQQNIQKNYFKETQYSWYPVVSQKNLYWSQALKGQANLRLARSSTPGSFQAQPAHNRSIRKASLLSPKS